MAALYVYASATSRKDINLAREALIVVPSHTHYGPDTDVHKEGLDEGYDRDDDLVAAYREFVDETLVEVIEETLSTRTVTFDLETSLTVTRKGDE